MPFAKTRKLYIPSIIKQFFKFCRIGAINTIVSLIVIFILSEVLGFHYLTANILGYAVGVLLGFILHKTLTFEDTSTKTKTQFSKFISVFLITYILQLIALTVFINIFSIFEFMAQILAAGVYTILNFAGNKFITFKEKTS